MSRRPPAAPAPSTWTRPAPPRPPPAPKSRRSRPTPALFFGLPERLIAEWAGVSPGHARLLKTGIRKPSRQVQKLILLYRQERVLQGPWARWICRDGKLVSPEGVQFDAAALDHHRQVVQFARDLAVRCGEGEYERFWELLA